MLKPPAGMRLQQGASLLEVLITMLLLSFAMLAMANLHATAIKYVKMSEFRGIATGLAFELTDRMRANAVTPANYVFTTAYSATAAVQAVPVCANVNLCQPAEMAAIDLMEVRNATINSLPGGFLRVAQDAANPRVLNVWILWLDPDGGDASTLLPCPIVAAPQPQCLAMRVAL